jgi:DNA-binding transcriptional LysR family regulator
MIDLRQLRQFIAVAEEMHFHRAAQRLNMSQPPLSAAIRRLEEEIGAELIERGNRTVGLTAAGAVLLQEAKRTIAQADRAVSATREAAQGCTGVVRLTCVGSALYGRLPERLRRFRQTAPKIQIDLREATSAQQLVLLRDDGADVGIVIPPIPDAGDLLLRDFDRDRLVIALPRSHPLALQADVPLHLLADEPFVLWPAAEGRSFHLRVIRLCAAAGFVPRIVQEAHQMQAVLSFVAVEAGVSVVPASMQAFRPDDVVYRPIPEADAEFTLSLIWRSGPASPATERLVNFLLEEDGRMGAGEQVGHME